MAAARTTRATTSSSAAPFLRLEREQACKGNLMALSMVYTREDAVPGKKDFGQVWRDRLRLVQLENNGWKVYSCDLGHEESLGEPDRHLQSNFDHHRFPEAFKKRWPEGLELRQVIFDYFYIPDHWADQRWGSGTFITKTIPFLRDFAKVKEFWLPNCRVMRDLLYEHEQFLSARGLIWNFVGERWKNVLYVATEQVNGVMEASESEVKMNANQVDAYLDPVHPFIRIADVPAKNRRRYEQEEPHQQQQQQQQQQQVGKEGGGVEKKRKGRPPKQQQQQEQQEEEQEEEQQVGKEGGGAEKKRKGRPPKQHQQKQKEQQQEEKEEQEQQQEENEGSAEEKGEEGGEKEEDGKEEEGKEDGRKRRK